ncbi:carboxymuconolactone decarboxylase family protein [Streptomyces griseorubiginosus]|uniref:Uncharacterized protein n=1 Tax=Streptomyces griseorubiginosus TaxID=67304 RepID=A0A117QXE0_9ACTN|nr:carboxymuconolactone decarboxylase family protein [Streptomyces griseorubiginosus]KUN59486.1 hypothetical protein AQJ54_39225 [Streptomyces griseorubiginosus]
MARLPYPDRSTFPQDLQDFLAKIPEHRNFNMMSYSISTIEQYIRQGVAQYTGLQLPARSRELIILTTAAAGQAEYEFVQHVPISESAGVDPEIREAIHRLEFDSPRLSADDRAVVNFTAAVVRSPFVSDEVFDAVRVVLSNREILEAMQVIGFYWSFGRVATVLQVEIESAHGTAVVEASRNFTAGRKEHKDH